MQSSYILGHGSKPWITKQLPKQLRASHYSTDIRIVVDAYSFIPEQIWLEKLAACSTALVTLRIYRDKSLGNTGQIIVHRYRQIIVYKFEQILRRCLDTF